MKYWRK